jgi:hypothetical protein
MADLTPSLHEILTTKHSQSHKFSPAYSLSTAKLDAFLTEAYQINTSITQLLTYLRAVRTPYLSTAPASRVKNKRQANGHAGINGRVLGNEIPEHLTDPQREAIDSETSSVLRELNTSITNLSNATSLQSTTARQVLDKKYGKPSGILWRWAAGDDPTDTDAGKSVEQIHDEGVLNTMKGFREGVLWYLNDRLRIALDVQGEMVQKRLDREREKARSVLYDPRNKGVQISTSTADDLDGLPSTLNLRGKDTYRPDLEPSRQDEQQNLTEEQLHLFASENSTLLNHYNSQLSKVTTVEKSLFEISSLQQTLVSHLTTQGEMIGGLVSDASNTDENVRKGNKELKKASERGSTARAVFFGTLGICSFLVIWDAIF